MTADELLDIVDASLASANEYANELMDTYALVKEQLTDVMERLQFEFDMKNEWWQKTQDGQKALDRIHRIEEAIEELGSFVIPDIGLNELYA